MRTQRRREDGDSGGRRAELHRRGRRAKRRPPKACRPTSTSINGFPLDEDFFDGFASRYTRVLTLEDGLIGTRGVRPARVSPGLPSRQLAGRRVRCITSASSIRSVAPSESFLEVWEHFGMTEAHMLRVLHEKP